LLIRVTDDRSEVEMATTRRPNATEKKSDPSVSYDEFKEYEGRKYTGMKIGRSHKWKYDPGEWKETKVTPDLWQISYAVTKRRAGRAPEGSGVPVGTEYHWYIVAHQNVEKLDANNYTTSLSGLKFKVAHRRADTGKWSTSPATQRKRMIGFLRDLIQELEGGADAAAPKRVKAVTRKAVKRGTSARKTTRRTLRVPPSMTKATRRRRRTTVAKSR
jgi:hypothetical protein